MPKYLHILNGDAAHKAFKTQSIEGEAIVWREVLCEGPTLFDMGSNSFWEIRTTFFKSFFEVPPHDFRRQTIQEFNTLKNSIKYFNEVILWFEYDLFCQINLIGLLSWLHIYKPKYTAVSIISLGEFPGYAGLVGLGEIDPAHYPTLFQDRQQLNQKDLVYANAIWKVYNSNNHKELKSLAGYAPLVLPHLDDALHAHFQRFPKVKNGLNEIETFIIQYIHQKEKATLNEIVGALLSRPNFYGFGDLQYAKYIHNLKPLLNWGDQLSLNALGVEVLEEADSFLLYANHVYRFGGTFNTDFRWVPSNDMLVKVERL